ncbi:transmembrane protein 51 isoform 2-T3 [Thomomys bottae]
MAQSKASGSHYALTAIGLGMLVLGIIMAMWNLVPGFSADKPTAHGNKTEIGSGILKSKTFSVAYVLVGAGVALLLLSICLSVRDKREQRRSEELARMQQQAGATPRAREDDSQEEEEEEEEASARYYVPSYEEVMNSSHSGARELEQSPGMGASLPSYESLTGLGESTLVTTRADTEAGAGRPPERQNSKMAKRLKPLKVRRIKSEKLHLKDFRINLPDKNIPPPSIEPLTPPPQYDEVQERTPEARPPD